ncbi:hypothetical protein ACT691_03290 [Vibrio metschnikovii]
MDLNQFDSLLPPQMAERAAVTGESKATKPMYKSFLLAISAGVHIEYRFCVLHRGYHGRTKIFPTVLLS